MPGKGAPSVLRKSVWLAARRRCAACRKRIALAEMHCDHILPVEKRGADDVRNLRCLCVDCHKFRHGWTGQVSYCRLLKSGWEVHGTARYIVPSNRVVSYLKIKRPHQPKSLLSFVSYERQLECGCRFRSGLGRSGATVGPEACQGISPPVRRICLYLTSSGADCHPCGSTQ